MWYKQWKVCSGCLEKIALGNSQGQIFKTTIEDFPFLFRLFDKNSDEYEAQSGPRFNSARRYSPIGGLTPSSGVELWPLAEAFFALLAKTELLTLFVLILGHFRCSVVTSVTFSSDLSNFEKNKRNKKI